MDGRNPLIAHEFLGQNLKGKDVVILDDMISSGESMLDVAQELKKRDAGRIFICSTFGLFTNGLETFDKAYNEGLFDRIITTNLIYQPDELLKREYYLTADMSKYIAKLIDALNHDASISKFLDQTSRIQTFVQKYRENQKQ